MQDDGSETVKNQGRQDIKNKWKGIEDKWVDIIHKQSGDASIQWIDSKEHRSYQMPKEEFSVSEADFRKTKIDYLLYQENIDVVELSAKISQNVIYESDIVADGKNIRINLKREG